MNIQLVETKLAEKLAELAVQFIVRGGGGWGIGGDCAVRNNGGGGTLPRVESDLILHTYFFEVEGCL